MPPKTAPQVNEWSLFHYEPYCREHLLQTLVDRTLYLSRPSGFNDPWDCRPWFNPDALEDADIKEKTIQWLVTASDGKESASILRGDSLLLRVTIEAYEQHIIDKIDAEYRVYCLTPNGANLLMWSHYARNHRGIALRFDTRSEPIIGAFQVNYLDSLPSSMLVEDDIDAATKALLTKSDVWKYENEFRLLAREGDAAPADMLHTENNKIKLPVGSLIAIVVGCESEHADEIVDLVEQHAAELEVHKARRNAHKYTLDIEKIYCGK
jgi:Protein of unknown function (DUF2971)